MIGGFRSEEKTRIDDRPLVLSDGDEYIPLKEIAESEGISQKYLESIMTVLSKAGFVDAIHGKSGGDKRTNLLSPDEDNKTD